MSNSVCLLDWDGTLRRGYVISDWTGFLVERGVIDRRFQEQMELHFRQFETAKLNYEQMAELVVRAYAASQAGLRLSSLEPLANEFVASDCNVFSFVAPLVELLRENGIEAAVISGSPLLVVRRFAEQLGIRRCYGLELPVDPNGTLLGTPGINLAVARNKQSLVDQLRSEFDHVPFAFGNSESDQPLLQAARHAYYIIERQGAEELAAKVRSALLIENLNVVSPEQLLLSIRNGQVVV